MYYYDEQPYYEPSIADEIFMEYQQKMKEALLESVKYDIENTKNENTRLKEENQKLRDQQRQIEWKERQLTEKEKTLEFEFFKKKFSDLLKPYEEKYSGYYADYIYRKIKKCKLCDKERKVTYTAPNGDTVKQACSCNKTYKKYIPKHSMLQVLNLSKSRGYNDRNFIISPEYKKPDDDDYRWSKLRFTEVVEVFDESVAEDLEEYDTLFTSKEECKKYCDWLNKNVNEDYDEAQESED